MNEAVDVQQNSIHSLIQLLTTLKKKALENTVEKGKTAHTHHFLLFPQSFQPLSRRKIIIIATFILLSANAFNLFLSKNLSFVKQLKQKSKALTFWHSKGKFLVLEETKRGIFFLLCEVSPDLFLRNKWTLVTLS